MMDTSQHYSNNQRSPAKLGGIIAVVAIVFCGLGFFGGVMYQKSHNKNPTTNSGQFGQSGFQNDGSGGMGLGNGQRPNIGEVKTVSSSSITISGTQSGAEQTFTITSTTTVDNGGSTAAVSDIKTGDTVLIQTDSSDSSAASKITLNPSFQRPQTGS